MVGVRRENLVVMDTVNWLSEHCVQEPSFISFLTWLTHTRPTLLLTRQKVPHVAVCYVSLPHGRLFLSSTLVPGLALLIKGKLTMECITDYFPTFCKPV